MSERPDLRLAAGELAAFLDAALHDDPRVPWGAAGSDGYPVVGLSEAALVEGGLRFAGAAPADGDAVCAIVERGATYDDITAVVARGRVAARTLPLDDLVTFAFAKAKRPD